eukprot:4141348-Amphidinium_carterae.2
MQSAEKAAKCREVIAANEKRKAGVEADDKSRGKYMTVELAEGRVGTASAADSAEMADASMMQAVSTAGTSQMYTAGAVGQADTTGAATAVYAAGAAATTESAAEATGIEIQAVVGEKGYDPTEDTVYRAPWRWNLRKQK